MSTSECFFSLLPAGGRTEKCAETSETFGFLSEVKKHAAKVPFSVPQSILTRRGQPAFSFAHSRDLRPVI